MKRFSSLLFCISISTIVAQNAFPTNGNVGIGTVNPLTKLYVYKGPSGGNPHEFSDITLEDNENGMISILTPNNRNAYYGFSDNDDDFVGGMQYNHSNDELTLRVNNHDCDLVINKDGYVGIGVTAPEYNLHVLNGVRFRKTTIGATIANNDNGWIRDDWLTGNYGPAKWDDTVKKWVRPSGSYNDIGGIIWQDEGTYFFRKPSGSQLEFSNTELLHSAFLFANMFTGNVGIGTISPDSKLTVKGKVHAEEVKVDLSVPGPDYVFKEGYDLKSLKELQNYIKEHGHLPNIPSAKEMEQNGVELGTMNMKLLEKIEELVLYSLEQEDKLKKESEINKEQEERLAKQEKRLRKIENILTKK